MDLHTFIDWLFDLQRQTVPRVPTHPDFEDTTVTVYTRSSDDEREAAWTGELQEA